LGEGRARIITLCPLMFRLLRVATPLGVISESQMVNVYVSSRFSLPHVDGGSSAACCSLFVGARSAFICLTCCQSTLLFFLGPLPPLCRCGWHDWNDMYLPSGYGKDAVAKPKGALFVLICTFLVSLLHTFHSQDATRRYSSVLRLDRTTCHAFFCHAFLSTRHDKYKT
jgi:hypothetical protein